MSPSALGSRGDFLDKLSARSERESIKWHVRVRPPTLALSGRANRRGRTYLAHERLTALARTAGGEHSRTLTRKVHRNAAADAFRGADDYCALAFECLRCRNGIVTTVNSVSVAHA